jgi:hypothetical protein
MARRDTGWFLGSAFLLVGAILLGAAMFSPWYFYNEQRGVIPGSGGTIANRDAVYYLDPLTGGGAVQYSCLGSPEANFCPLSSSFANAGLNNTGSIALVSLALTGAGFALGVLCGVFGAVVRKHPRWTAALTEVALLSVVLAVSASTSFAGLLPGAFARDVPGTQLKPYANYTGPWSSFYGSTPITNPSGSSITSSWGPGTGWYLSIAAVVAFLIGTVLLIRYRRSFAEAVPSSGPPESTSTHATKPPKSTA